MTFPWKNKQNKTYMHLNNEQGDRCTTDEEVAEQVRNYMIQFEIDSVPQDYTRCV